MSKHSKLESEGWERRSVLSEPRLSEAVELYEQLGFEVKQVPLDPDDLPEGCGECYKQDIDNYRIVYIRKKI